MKNSLDRLEIKIFGYTLIELLIVLGIFAVLAAIMSQALGLSLRSSRKSENIAEVRENVTVAVGVAERLLRNAQTVDCATSQLLNYVDEYGNSTSLSCIDTDPSAPGIGYIASGSANLRLTSIKTVDIDCLLVFECTAATTNSPAVVDIKISGKSLEGQAEEAAEAESSAKILLRSY